MAKKITFVTTFPGLKVQLQQQRRLMDPLTGNPAGYIPAEVAIFKNLQYSTDNENIQRTLAVRYFSALENPMMIVTFTPKTESDMAECKRLWNAAQPGVNRAIMSTDEQLEALKKENENLRQALGQATPIVADKLEKKRGSTVILGSLEKNNQSQQEGLGLSDDLESGSDSN